MAFKATFTKLRMNRHRRGSTLMEYLFAIGIGSMAIVVMASFALYHGKSMAILANLVDLEQDNRAAQAQMSRDFRQVSRLQSYTTNRVSFVDWDGKTLNYTYDPTDRVLIREKDGISKVMLKECDRLGFTIRQRNIIGGTFDYYAANSLDTCKVVGVDWSCTRTLLGKKMQLTSSQSSRIAIRKH